MTHPMHRGHTPKGQSAIISFFWLTYIPAPHDQGWQAMADVCWTWTGYMMNGTTPVMSRRLDDGQRCSYAKISVRQYIYLQAHPDATKRHLNMTCGRLDCVNPFQMEPGGKVGGRTTNIKLKVTDPDILNRAALLHHYWKELREHEEETKRQRSLPQYLQ